MPSVIEISSPESLACRLLHHCDIRGLLHPVEVGGARCGGPGVRGRHWEGGKVPRLVPGVQHINWGSWVRCSNNSPDLSWIHTSFHSFLFVVNLQYENCGAVWSRVRRDSCQTSGLVACDKQCTLSWGDGAAQGRAGGCVV